MHCQILPIITFITTVACKEVNRGKMNTNYSNTTMNVHVYVHVNSIHHFLHVSQKVLNINILYSVCETLIKQNIVLNQSTVSTEKWLASLF